MKDASAFGPDQPRYLVLATVTDQNRSNLASTIDAIREKAKGDAQAVGGQLHEECSSVVTGPWDLALYFTVPNHPAIFALMESLSQGGKIRTESYAAYPINNFSQLAKSAWTKTGAQSPVETTRR